MIVIGYQGIGKSTLCNKGSGRYIDLESGNFWVDGKRDDNWASIYANIAEHLSKQGYVVFTSSHKVVREALKDSDEDVYIIHPALSLKGAWITKLHDRYTITGLDKDYKAWRNAEEMFDQNIQDLMDDPIPSIPIKSIHYSLDKMIDNLKYPLTFSGVNEKCESIRKLLKDTAEEVDAWMCELAFMLPEWDEDNHQIE